MVLDIFKRMRERLAEQLRVVTLQYPKGHPIRERVVAEAQELEEKIKQANELLKEKFGWEKNTPKSE
jgi:hypothetical protein